jgi:hypothetical protein
MKLSAVMTRIPGVKYLRSGQPRQESIARHISSDATPQSIAVAGKVLTQLRKDGFSVSFVGKGFDTPISIDPRPHRAADYVIAFMGDQVKSNDHDVSIGIEDDITPFAPTRDRIGESLTRLGAKLREGVDQPDIKTYLLDGQMIQFTLVAVARHHHEKPINVLS